MKMRLLILWNAFRENFWFIPGTLSLLAAALSLSLSRIEQSTAYMTWMMFDFSSIMSISASQSLLSAIIASSITVTGVVFSVTISVLVNASTHYGTGLLPKFTQLRTTQVTLGFFLASFIYAILLYPQVDSLSRENSAAPLPLLIAVMLSIISFFSLIHFIHCIIHFLQPSSVIKRVKEDLIIAIQTAYPERDAEEAKPQYNVFENEAAKLLCKKSGYIEAIELDQLRNVMRDNQISIDVNVAPGDYVYIDDILLRFYTQKTIESSVCDDARKAFIIGSERFAPHNPRSSIEQLVEIAVRALSPGINAPFLAIECIHRIGESLVMIARRGPPRNLIPVDNQVLRNRWYCYEDLCHSAFYLLRDAGCQHALVLHQLMKIIEQVVAINISEDLRKILLEHAELIYRQASESITNDPNRDLIERIYMKLGQTLTANNK